MKNIKYEIWIDQVNFHILKCICPEYIQCVDMENWLYAGVVTQLAYDAPSLPPSSARASHHGCAGEHQPSRLLQEVPQPSRLLHVAGSFTCGICEAVRTGFHILKWVAYEIYKL